MPEKRQVDLAIGRDQPVGPDQDAGVEELGRRRVRGTRRSPRRRAAAGRGDASVADGPSIGSANGRGLVLAREAVAGQGAFGEDDELRAPAGGLGEPGEDASRLAATSPISGPSGRRRRVIRVSSSRAWRMIGSADPGRGLFAVDGRASPGRGRSGGLARRRGARRARGRAAGSAGSRPRPRRATRQAPDARVEAEQVIGHERPGRPAPMPGS